MPPLSWYINRTTITWIGAPCVRLSHSGGLPAQNQSLQTMSYIAGDAPDDHPQTRPTAGVQGMGTWGDHRTTGPGNALMKPDDTPCEQGLLADVAPIT